MSKIGASISGAFERTAGAKGRVVNESQSTGDVENNTHEISSSPKQRSEEMRQLARQMTQRSMHSGDQIFSKDRGPELDPFSPQFDARRWVGSLAELSRNNSADPASGKSCVAFKSMSVHGYGSDAGRCSVWCYE